MEPKQLSKSQLDHYENLASEYQYGDIARLLAHISHLETHLSRIENAYDMYTYMKCVSPESKDNYLNSLLECVRDITYPAIHVESE